MIRSYYPNDLNAVAQIHEQYYANEFPLPDFINHFLCSFSVVENGEIISVGGVRTILESIVITDKSKSVRVRANALHEILAASMFTAGRCNYNEIHASIINDPKWKQHLAKVGFKPIKGEMLVLEV